MNRLLAVLVVALLAVAPVRADVGPPPGTKAIPVTTTVDAPDDVSDYAFFAMSWSSTPGPPPHGGTSRSITLHFFVPGSSITATGARRSGGRLYAVPRGVAERIPGWTGFAADAAKKNPPKHSTVSNSDENLFALARSVEAGEVPGATFIKFGGNEEVPTADPRTAITVRYRIARTPAGVAFVNPDDPEPTGERGKCGNDGPSDTSETLTSLGRTLSWRWVAAGGAASLAGVLAGVWIVWRVSRRGRTT